MVLTQRQEKPHKDEGVCTMENFDFILHFISMLETVLEASILGTS